MSTSAISIPSIAALIITVGGLIDRISPLLQEGVTVKPSDVVGFRKSLEEAWQDAERLGLKPEALAILALPLEDTVPADPGSTSPHPSQEGLKQALLTINADAQELLQLLRIAEEKEEAAEIQPPAPPPSRETQRRMQEEAGRLAMGAERAALAPEGIPPRGNRLIASGLAAVFVAALVLGLLALFGVFSGKEEEADASARAAEAAAKAEEAAVITAASTTEAAAPPAAGATYPCEGAYVTHLRVEEGRPNQAILALPLNEGEQVLLLVVGRNPTVEGGVCRLGGDTLAPEDVEAAKAALRAAFDGKRANRLPKGGIRVTPFVSVKGAGLRVACDLGDRPVADCWD